EEKSIAFYPDKEDAGTLRLNVFTLSAKEDVEPAEFARPLARRAQDVGAEVEQLGEGRGILAYQQEAENEDEGPFWGWELVAAVGPRHALYAVLTFSIPAGSEEANAGHVTMLDRELRRARFAGTNGGR